MAVNLADVVTMATLEINTTTFTAKLTPDYPSTPTAVEALAVALMAVLILCAFQANLWIIITIMVTPQLRSCMTNIFVVNLCTVDLVASLVAMPLSVLVFLRGRDVLSKEVCAVNGFFNTFVMISSMLFLCAVSVERYYSISLPMHYAGHATPCIYLIVVAFIWCTGVILSVLPLAGVSAYCYHPAKRACTYVSQEHTTSDSTFVILIFIISFLLPSLIMVAMYVNIFRVARKAAATVGPRPRPGTAVDSGPGIKTGHNSNRQPIFTISTHTAATNIQSKMSQSDLPRAASLNDSEYSKTTFSKENRIPTEDYSTRPWEVITNESHHLPAENKHGSKQEATGQGTTWLHDHLHLDTAHCKFLCVCSRKEPARNTSAKISVSHVQSPDSTLIPALHRPEGDAQTNPKDNCHEVSIAVGKVKPSHTKALRTLMIIVVTHLIVWGPYFVCQIYEQARGRTVSQVAEIVTIWLSFVSYTANPCLYGLMNRTIREELGQLLKMACAWGCCCSCSQGVVTWRRPCHHPPADSECEEDGFGEGENFYQFLQRTQASDTSAPANLDAERNR